MRRSAFGARAALAVLACATICLAAGCGGGMNTGTATGRAGGARMTVKWPARSRLVPEAAGSIKVDVAQGSGTVATTVLVRPSDGGQTTATFDALPIGDLTVTASAYPTATGSGIAQAQATVAITVKAGQVSQFVVTMGSTIDHVELTPSSFSLDVGQTARVTATAKDAASEVVLTAPDKVQWSSDNTAVATVDGAGIVTAVAAGSANVTATETESGKSASAVVTVAGSGTSSPSPEYTVTDLGALAADMNYSEGNGINGVAQVVGASLTAGASHAYLWQNGQMQDLGALPGADSYAYAINDGGLVVGASNEHAVSWQSGQIADMGAPQGGYTAAYAANAGGQVVGVSYDMSGIPHAYVWQSGQATDIGTLGGDGAIAYGVNRAGQVAGGADIAPPGATSPVEHAFVWQSGQMRDLGTLGSYQSVATALNDSGQVVGQVYDESTTHGFFWQNGQMTDLGSLPADLPTIQPLAINGQGVVVGTASSSTDSRAFRWQSGLMQDLNDLIAPGSGWVLSEAHGVNDQGQIVGNGFVNGTPHAFLLTPASGRSAALGARTGGRPVTGAHRSAASLRQTARYHARYLSGLERRRRSGSH